ncbi:3-deoxy-manno-octulosonate cytidylyltransferase [Thermodesulfobacteriota bacterium]
MKAAIVIPARYDSSRLPGKPLVDICGRPLIVRVLEGARAVRGIDRVVVATDDERILAVVAEHDGEALLTSADHGTGTERIAEAVCGIEADIVINLQGDEPLVRPEMVEILVRAMGDEPGLQMATLSHPVVTIEDVENPNIVKVVTDLEGYALYFSRLPVPFLRSDAAGAPGFTVQKHIGIYAYRRDWLLRFASLDPTPLEMCEKLEQLRALENGIRIRVLESPADTIGVDTEEDLVRVREIFAGEGVQ